MSGITRNYSLPFGCQATFSWRDPDFRIEWHPRFPRIRKQRARRKFVAAYQAARRDFYRDVAAMINKSILIIDTDLKTIDGTEVITAPTRH